MLRADNISYNTGLIPLKNNYRIYNNTNTATIANIAKIDQTHRTKNSSDQK